MKYKPLIGTSMSGSLGGIVASHNAGGAYFRSKVIPTNPNTTFQQAVRAAMSTLTNVWQNTLTQAQRDAWKTYADNVPVLDKIGAAITLSPLAMYIRSNVIRLQNAVARVDAAPTIFNLGTFTAPLATTSSTGAQTISFSYTNTDDWAITTLGFLIFQFSRPQNSGIQFFKGPYRLASKVAGNTTTPPTSPAAIAAPFPFAAGQKVFFRATAITADGRVSQAVEGFRLT